MSMSYVEVLDLLGLELCTKRQIWVYFHSSTHRQPVRPAPFIEDTFFFPLYIFGAFVKNQMTVSVWFYFWVFNSIPLINMSVSEPIPSSFYYFFSVAKLKFRDADSPTSSFIVKIDLAILDFLPLQMNLRIDLFFLSF